MKTSDNPISGGPVPVLHVEVGGAWGGSMRILELQLRHSDSSRFTHDVLFYYATPGAERFEGIARKVWTLYDSKPKPLRVRRTAKWRSTLGRLRAVQQLYAWVHLLRDLGTAIRIAAILKRSDYRVVHVNNTFSYQPATLIASWMAALPVVSHTRNPVANSFLNRGLSRLTQVIATANEHSERQLRSWPTQAAIKTCYEPAECSVPDPAAVLNLRKELLADGDVLVGSIGRLDKQKGFAYMIRAARTVLDAFPHARFAIAGVGPEEPALNALIASLGLTGKFRLYGFCPDCSNFLAALDLFVCPSLWEGSPLSLVEAMLLGKPSVSTNVGIADALIPEPCELVAPADSDGLAKAIVTGLSKNSTAVRRTEERRQRAARLSNPLSTTRQLEEIFEQIFFRDGVAVRQAV